MKDLTRLQPRYIIYLRYLESYDLDKDDYKYEKWVEERLDRYKKESKLSVIRDQKKFIVWLGNLIK